MPEWEVEEVIGEAVNDSPAVAVTPDESEAVTPEATQTDIGPSTGTKNKAAMLKVHSTLLYIISS